MGHRLKVILPRRVVRLREMQALSQAALAEKAGMAASTLCAVESGLPGDLHVSTLLKLCDALGVSPDWLLGYSDGDIPRGWIHPACHHCANTFTPLAPGANSPQAAPVASNCGLCGAAIPPGGVHQQGDCMLVLSERYSETAIAAMFGFDRDTVTGIIVHEATKHRRRRR